MPHELRKAAHAKLGDAQEDAARGAEVEIRAIHGIRVAGEGDAACLEPSAGDTERAQLSLDDRLDPWCRDREELERTG
ncbi:MAG TPA: hypothetical protein VFB46_02625 [Gemmatimonadaceae bacterium]|nr:hypothetical protein [Gemmatimonadaceae bacterium]